MMITSKIKSIAKCKDNEDVYDIIGVSDNHNFIANNIVVHNCDIFTRGRGAVFVKDMNPVKDTWRLDDFKKIGSYTEFSKTKKIEQELKKHANFWKIIKFPRPSEQLYKKYLLTREQNVYDDDNVFSTLSKEDIIKSCMVLTLKDIMMNDSSMNMSRIILHIKNEYDINIGKAQLEDVVDDSKKLIMKIREQANRDVSGFNKEIDDKTLIVNTEEKDIDTDNESEGDEE